MKVLFGVGLVLAAVAACDPPAGDTLASRKKAGDDSPNGATLPPSSGPSDGGTNPSDASSSNTGDSGSDAGSAPPCKTTDDAIRVTYRMTLLREPDAAGFANWQSVLAMGTSRLDMLRQFIGGGEFVTAHQSMDDDTYVTGLYTTFFQRAPDAAGKAHYLELLGGGTSRQDVALDLVNSPEFTGAGLSTHSCFF